MVEWRSGDDVGDGRAGRQFYSLRDLEIRLERESIVPPSLLIFHCSRCGSTLLARLLEIDPANRVFIEPGALRDFLHANRMQLHLPELQRDLAILVRSYGLEPRVGEKRLIVKLNSVAVYSLAAFRAALPEVACAYLLRAPEEVAASLAHDTPPFLRAENRTALAEVIGADAGAISRDTDAQWRSRYVEWNLRTAFTGAGAFSSVTDYRDYATQFLRVACAWSDSPLSPDDPAVAETLSRDAKRPGMRFAPREDNNASARAARTSACAYSRWRERLEQLE